MKIKNYKQLIVWQKAMSLVMEIYKLVKILPREELFALSDQMRRAAVSVPSNIAEGNARHYTKDYIFFLSVARASTAELETQLLICINLNYIKKDQAESALNLCNELTKMLTTMLIKLEARKD